MKDFYRCLLEARLAGHAAEKRYRGAERLRALAGPPEKRDGERRDA